MPVRLPLRDRGVRRADDVHEEWDVCDWLNANRDVKAALDGLIEAYVGSMHPNFPSDVIHAAAEVSTAAGDLMSHAVSVYHFDDIVDRSRLHCAANAAGATALRFLLEIGNLKGREEVRR